MRRFFSGVAFEPRKQGRPSKSPLSPNPPGRDSIAFGQLEHNVAFHPQQRSRFVESQDLAQRKGLG